MADYGFKPEIALGLKPAPTMTLPEMLNFARSAQMYQKESEYLPLYVRQQEAATKSAEFKLDQDQSNYALQLVGGYRNDPRINSGDKKQTFEAMMEIRRQLINAGVPEFKVDGLMKIGNQIALEKPERLPQYFDNVIQGASGPTSQLGLQTGSIVPTPAGPAIYRPGPGTIQEPRYPQTTQPAPQAASQPTPQLAQPPAPTVSPAGAAEVSPVAPPGLQVSPIEPTATGAAPGQAGPGYALKFPVISPTDVRPRPIGWTEAMTSGKQYRERMNEAKDAIPTATGYLDEVMRLAKEIGADAVFTTGKLSDIERTLRQFFQDPRYQELSKNIARGELMILQAQGGSMQTDAAKDLIAKASGTSSYDPGVLAGIVKKQLAEFQNIKMQSEGARRASELYSDANLEGFREAWSKNADLKVFEAMAIQDRIKDPKLRDAALDKVLPKDKAALQDFLMRFDNLNELTQTGRLKGR